MHALDLLPLAKRSPAPSWAIQLCLAPPSTSTSPPRCISSHHLQSIRRLPLFPLHFPLKVRRRTSSYPSKPSGRSRPSPADAPNARRPRQLSSSRFTYRHRAGWGASGLSSVGGDEFCLGVLFTRFRTFPCLTLVLDFLFLFLLP